MFFYMVSDPGTKLATLKVVSFVFHP